MLVEKIVKFIDVDGDRILITLEDDTKLLFEHRQDCCESVYIYDSIGDLHNLVGKKLISVENETSDIPDDVDYVPCDFSYTWTNVIFKTDEDTVISRWIGESNGYYSESVDLSILSGKNIEYQYDWG